MIITAGNDRQFRALCEVLGIPRCPTTRSSRPTPTAPATATLCAILVAELAKWKADDLFVALNKAGVPCGPINTIGEGVELAESLGSRPRAELGTGDRAVSLVRNPIGFGDAD